MRCTVERATATTDAGGGQTLTWATYLSGVRCRAWFDARRESAREAVQGSKLTVLEDRRLIVPAGTDVREGDRIASVTDRLGATLYAGPMAIESVGRRRDHLILYVREVS